MIRKFFLFCLLLGTATSHAHARELQTPLDASSPWNLNYTKSSCELRRSFGTGDAQILFIIVQGVKFGTLELILFTPKVGGKQINWKADIALRGAAAKVKKHATVYPSQENGKSVWRIYNLETEFLKSDRQTDILDVKIGSRAWVSLELESLADARKALETCQRELLKSFDMDFDTLVSLTRHPEPKGESGRWVTTDDYPPAARREKLEGETEIKVDVSERGKVADCTIISSSGHEILDQAVCLNVRNRANFKPAVDSDGKSTSGVWISRTRWQVPR